MPLHARAWFRGGRAHAVDHNLEARTLAARPVRVIVEAAKRRRPANIIGIVFGMMANQQ